MNSKIIGIGSYVPEKCVTNFDMEKMVDTSDKWITQRTGIKTRHFCSENEGVLDMAVYAARAAIGNADIPLGDIDGIIVATSTPDILFPSVSCRLMRELGLKDIFCFDISAACTSFIYALDMADRYIKTGGAKTMLVVSTEHLSRILDMTDRSTCVLFGDGAGAAVVTQSDCPGVLASFLSAKPAADETLTCQLGGFVQMNGQDVFKFATRAMREAIDAVLEKSGKTIEDIAYIFPHQANIRILQSVIDRYKTVGDRVVITIADYANTSSSTIPIALDIYNKQGKLKKGDNIILVGFGAGLTYGSLLIEWQ